MSDNPVTDSPPATAATVVCPACEKPVEGKRGPMPRKPGSYVHVCGATFIIGDDGKVRRG